MLSFSLLFRFLSREWLLAVALAGLVATSLHLGRFPGFSPRETEVLLLLWALFVPVRGLELSGLMRKLAVRVEASGNHLAVGLVLLTFLLAAVATNDAALVVVAPLTMSLRTPGRARLVILEALAANAGSALTPFGNPQNLYIFWKYAPRAPDFMATIAPFSLFSLALLLIAATMLPVRAATPSEEPAPAVSGLAWMHAGLLVLAVLVILRILPVWMLLLTAACTLLFDRRSLRVDYGLLLTFAAFFALSDNLRMMLAGVLENGGHVFTLSALASQVLSNVPATLLFSRFTDDWQALLWGVNVGGYGTLIASFANLIAWRAFMNAEKDGTARRLFAVRFLFAGLLLFLATTTLHWIILWRG